jgi:hypothetical protein
VGRSRELAEATRLLSWLLHGCPHVDERCLAISRRALGEDAYAAEVDHARRLTLDQVIACALEEDGETAAVEGSA